MANLETLNVLLANLNAPGLTEAMGHPEWSAAYEDTVNGMNLPFREKDVNDAVTLVHVLDAYSFELDNKGRIRCDTLQVGTSGYTWVDGKWVDSDDVE